MTGFDTETDRGQAILLATPRRWLAFPNDFASCVDFLLSAGDEEFFCWNSEYDVEAILTYLDPEYLEQLYYKSRVKVMAQIATSGGWQNTQLHLHYVPRKFFEVRAGQRKFGIYDLAQFYGMSLDRASKLYLGRGKLDPGVSFERFREVLKRGWHDHEARRIIEYCIDDATKAEELAHQTSKKFKAIKVDFERPISCASLAYRYFKKELTSYRIATDWNELARKTYRGGRIECLQAGYFPEAWYVDIRSAYPYAMSQLEEFSGHIFPVRSEADIEGHAPSYAALECDVMVPREFYKGVIPFKHENADPLLIYPVGFWRAWLDWTSFEWMRERGFIHRFHRGVIVRGVSSRKPFRRKIEELYQKRFLSEDFKWACKIILNALYGKTAETRRYHVEDPKAIGMKVFDRWLHLEHFVGHTNFFYAAEITARTRWKLYDEIREEDVIFYATDGVFLTKPPRSLDSGTELGQWAKAEKVRDLVVVGSGVYCYKTADGKVTTKFRGFDKNLDLYGLLEGSAHSIPIPVQRNQKLGQTLQNGRWDKMNLIEFDERKLDVNFDRKRIWEVRWKGCDLLKRSFRSKPWQMIE